jgi:taurine dioxygenase
MKVEKITPRIGATITGIDASKPLDAGTAAAILEALNDNGVIFFPGQAKLTGEQQLAFARQFGSVETPPKLTKESELRDVLILDFTEPVGRGTDIWHNDGSYLEKPPLGSILQAHILPECGGDTCFASMHAAYEALSPGIKAMLEGMTASHSTARVLELTRSLGNVSYDSQQDLEAPRSHPIVTVDPRSRRRRLFVNPNYTVSIDGMTKAESDHWLAFLYDHVKSPEFQMRYRWSVGDIAFWDNHAVQHYAVADYSTRRRMQRVTLAGYAPVGVNSVQPKMTASAAA